MSGGRPKSADRGETGEQAANSTTTSTAADLTGPFSAVPLTTARVTGCQERAGRALFGSTQNNRRRQRSKRTHAPENRHSVRAPRASTRNQVAHNRQYALPVTVVKSDGFEGVGRLEGLSVVLADRPRSSSLIPGSSFVVPSELRESAERLGFGWIVT